RHGRLSYPVSVDYSVSDGTATAGLDYVAQSGTINFPSQAESDCNQDGCTYFVESYQTITIPVLNDSVREGDETFTVTLSNPRGGAFLDSQSNAVVTIIDNEIGVSFDAGPYANAYEWGGEIDLLVRRGWDASTSTTVDYFTRNSTATAG